MIKTICQLFGLIQIVSFVVIGAPLRAQDGDRQPLWPNGAPGYEARADEAEVSKDWWTRNVHNPSITAFLPKPENATGAAVLILPGGGHELLVTTTEGRDPAKWFADHGIAAFVVRYRLFRAADRPYLQTETRADVDRAIRLVRSRADEYKIDANKIGVMGFSAGGELARSSALSAPVAALGVADEVDKISARPDFAILVFPGPLHFEENVNSESPPLLMVAANDDECCSQSLIDLLVAYRAKGGSAELHMYAQGGHAFNMGEATNYVSIKRWPPRITEWMVDRGFVPRTILDSGPLPP